jgi:hypothetical protein
MDPFIEGQSWADFHHELISAIREQLVPQLRPKYVANVRKTVYIERADHDSLQPVIPDVTIAARAQGKSATGAATTLVPTLIPLPFPLEISVPYLVIRTAGAEEVVSVIELLSPTNKRRPSSGRKKYLSKRNALLKTECNLIELDLLRGGARLPMRESLPAGDYYALVSRGDRRPLAEVYTWTLRDPLPVVPVPLVPGDADIGLDLATAFSAVYDRAEYDYKLHRDATIVPPLTDAESPWISERLQ